jgi:RimJ/RimL family protein N-acetyltransferase
MPERNEQPSEPPKGPAYRIETERLVIRCYQPTDAALSKAAIDASLDELRQWMPWAHHEPVPVEQKADLFRKFRGQFDHGQDYPYAVFSPDERELYGSTGLHARIGPDALEIGYWVATAHHRKGFATELAAAMTRVGFEVEKVHRIEIRCDPLNTRSFAVARKLGFTHEATLSRRLPQPDGSRRDVMLWTLFAEDYPQSPAAQLPLRAFDLLGKPLLG